MRPMKQPDPDVACDDPPNLPASTRSDNDHVSPDGLREALQTPRRRAARQYLGRRSSFVGDGLHASGDPLATAWTGDQLSESKRVPPALLEIVPDDGRAVHVAVSFLMTLTSQAPRVCVVPASAECPARPP
jgi:hypothetical protein